METHPVKYQFEVDLDDRNNGHALLAGMVAGHRGDAMDILEVGCSSGYVGATLVARGHRVTGIEADPVAAEAARARLQAVHAMEADRFLRQPATTRYDAILFGDVLEHIAEPETTLRLCHSHLAPDAIVAVSLPCITHGSIRAMLLDGRWDYAEFGLLDRTHLRFFSREGMAALMARGGFRIRRLQGTVMPIDTAAREYGMRLSARSIAAVETLGQDDPELLVFQFVVSASADVDAGFEALLAHNLGVPLEPAMPPPRPAGHRSLPQRLRTWLFRMLLRGIAARRFRGRSAATSA